MSEARKNLLRFGLKLLEEAGVDYGDVRAVDTDRELLLVRNGVLDPAVRTSDSGFGIRVLVDGAWGFSACERESEATMKSAVENALVVARASTTS